MSSENGFNIYLDSRHSVHPELPYNTKFTLADSRLSKLTNARVTLNKFCIPNSVLPFESYNKLYITESPATEITVTISNKLYTPTTFATELQTKLNAASGQVYTVTYDSTTMRVTITAASTAFKIRTGRGQIGTSSLYQLSFAKYLGFYSDTTFSLSKVAPGALNLSGSQYIDIRTNLPTNAVSSGPSQGILARIYLTSPPGSFVNYTEGNGSVFLNIKSGGFNDISIEIVDENGNPYLFKEHWSAVLGVHY